MLLLFFFFFKQKTAYEMRISDWSSDVCSSDLILMPAEMRDRLSHPFVQVKDPLHVGLLKILAKGHRSTQHLVINIEVENSHGQQCKRCCDDDKCRYMKLHRTAKNLERKSEVTSAAYQDDTNDKRCRDQSQSTLWARYRDGHGDVKRKGVSERVDLGDNTIS